MRQVARRRRIILFDLLAHTILAISLVAMVGIYILWSLGHRPGGLEWHVGSEDSESRLMICSRDNRLIVALYSPVRSSTWGRARYTAASASRLLDDPDSFVAADMFGWGVAGPHWVFALALATVPLFW